MAGRRIVIVGGGFGGAFTARYLRRLVPGDTEVELIDSNNYFVFQPLLPEVVSGNISAPDAVTPLRQLLPGIKVRMGTVIGVDRAARTVRLLQGSYRVPQESHYDHLVIAGGQRTNLDIAPGFRDHALSLRDLADAHELRNKVIRRLEHADVTADAVIKRRLLTFVVGGGGFSGVEAVGELSEMIRRTVRFYPNINQQEVRTVIVHSGDRLLPELHEKLGSYARKMLENRGVEVVLNTRVSSATANAVFLSNGERIDSCLFLSTVGNGPTEFCQSLQLPLERGKISVDQTLRVRGEENVWALGDSAMVPLDGSGERFAPPTAQYAVREARCLARNISAVLEGREPDPFDFTPRGVLASIGNYKGVARLFGMNFSGLPAWMLWRFAYIGMLPGFSTRLRVALNWLFDYFLPRSIVQIANRDARSTATRRYAKGDVLSRPGQYVDGLYTVLEGQLVSRIPRHDARGDHIRILGPGNHWGEVLATAGELTQGTLTAIEDTRVLIFRADDFRNLRQALPALEDYFQGIDPSVYAPSLRSRTPNRELAH